MLDLEDMLQSATLPKTSGNRRDRPNYSTMMIFLQTKNLSWLIFVWHTFYDLGYVQIRRKKVEK